TCSLSGGECCALVGGANQMSGTVTLQNLGNMGNVYSSGKQAAAIFGGNTGSKATLLVENCFGTGAIEGTDQCGALIGWAGSNGPKIYNSWSCSEVTGNDDEAMYLSRGGTLTNCYCTYGTQTPIITTDEIESGALCYRLNKTLTEDVWFQNIDKGTPDYNPFPFSLGHGKVYPIGAMLCDGSVIPGEITYSNSDTAVRPDHKFHDGFCDACGQEDPDYDKFLPIITNPDYTETTGWTSEGTAPSISNEVAEHYNHVFHTYQDIDTLQLANGVYKIRLQGFSRVGDVKTAECYETCELSDDLLRNSYFYGESEGKRAARRFVDIMTGKHAYSLMDGTGEIELGDGTFVPDGRAGYNKYFNRGIYW
ncbi:MAG: hypothetical protein HUK03_08210, partial [Bacteroidaceae bacterium]|nr:hypothetical protein [Bacteroidaceae bacterium]